MRERANVVAVIAIWCFVVVVVVVTVVAVVTVILESKSINISRLKSHFKHLQLISSFLFCFATAEARPSPPPPAEWARTPGQILSLKSNFALVGTKNEEEEEAIQTIPLFLLVAMHAFIYVQQA